MRNRTEAVVKHRLLEATHYEQRFRGGRGPAARLSWRAMTTSEAPRPAAHEPSVAAHVLLTHAALVGLTPLIPIPFLDDVVKHAIERRLVRIIASSHGRELSSREVKELTEEPSGNLVWSIGKGLALFPFKLIFKTVFLVLEVKAASDEASACYHRAVLIDRVLGSNVLAPDGPKSAAEVRRAVQEVASGQRVSPVGRAVQSTFDGSRAALTAIGRSLLGRIGARRAASAAAVEEAVEETAGEGGGPLGSLVSRLTSAVADVPSSHFEALGQALEEKLGISLRP